MSNKSINEALKDLFIGLGGDASALADNEVISDYIEDLLSAIKAEATSAAGDIIDDSEASEATTYSSSKVESLIPEAELPDVSEVADGAILAVVNGAWTLCTMSVDTTTGNITFTPVENATT